MGNIGSEPELRFTPSGKQTCSFRVATNRTFKGADGERKESVEWFSVVVWGKQAEACNQYLNKGSLIYCEGRMQTRSWEGQDGQKHYRTELIANQVIFLNRKQNANKEPSKENAEVPEGEVEPEDLPFQ